MHPKLIMMLGVLGVSVSSILVRWSDAPSLIIATYRLGWTVLLMLPVVLLRHRKELMGLTLRDLLLCGASGVFLALHFATWFESLKWTSVASSTVLVSTEVLFTALGFALFLHGKIPSMGLVAIGLSFGGSILLALADGGGGGKLYGDLLAVAGAVFVSIYTLIGTVLRGHLSTTIYTFVTYSACTLTLLILDGVTGTPLWGYQSKDLLVGLALAVLCTLMGHSVFSWCLKYLSPSYCSAVKLCEPVFAALLAAALFGEIPNLQQLWGALLVVGGVVLYTRAERPAKNKDPLPAQGPAEGDGGNA